MDRLKRYNYKYDGMLVDREYFNGEPNIYCIDDVIKNTSGKINVIIAYTKCTEDKLSIYADKIDRIINYDAFYGHSLIELEFTTYEWFLNNIDKLQNIYSMLWDKLSKDTFAAYIAPPIKPCQN